MTSVHKTSLCPCLSVVSDKLQFGGMRNSITNNDGTTNGSLSNYTVSLKFWLTFSVIFTTSCPSSGATSSFTQFKGFGAGPA